MSLTLGWGEIVLRLLATLVAGVVIGLNRSERGQAAGLRTTMLVALAAAVAMIQTNLMLATGGRTPESFVTMDLMRLPLGVLTGMGFIGGGAILRRGDVIQGVTTAATLWLVTVIGLCLGGGLFSLGLASLGLGLAILWCLRWLEARLQVVRHGRLALGLDADGPTEGDIRALLKAAGLDIRSWALTATRADGGPRRTIRCEVRWRGHADDFETPSLLSELATRPGVASLHWQTL